MTAAIIGFIVLITISLMGVPLAVASLITGVIGFSYLRGFESAIVMAGQQIAELTVNTNLVVIPIFILMGELARRSGITDELYALAEASTKRFRGGLAMSTVFASGAFSTVCGSSIATAATMTKVAMPSMRRYGYKDSLSAGTVAAGGTLGILIPPSVPMVIYCIFAQEDIGRMWMAGVGPGLVMIALFVLTIVLMVKIKPELDGGGVIAEANTSAPKVSLGMAKGFLVLFGVVLGGIYIGFFTPTEAASVGAFGAYVFALLRGKMRTAKEYREMFSTAAGISASIFAIASCALVFSQFINLSGLPYQLLDLIGQWELTGAQLVIAICLLCLVLGTVFDALGILLLIIPIFIPSLQALGIDLIWFGVLVIILIELGLITPPLGVNVFTVKAAQPDIQLKDIFAGSLPFVVAMLVTAVIVFYLPTVALFIPDLMK
ncbi:TRAP transporter large permease [Paenalcaligenes hominis]|uniref:TRAP transporter large permease n=1 Tax=Paenalcaligenes hominis TaxID=643674 RepID=UPI003526C217